MIQAIRGDKFVDDRGEICFVNDFNFDSVRRFYIVRNHSRNFVRAWHGHLNEGKYVYCVSGSAIVAAIRMEDMEKDNPVIFRTILSSISPTVLFIPAGYANGFMSLVDDMSLIFFSTSTLDQSKNDDTRYSADKFRHVWKVEER